MATLTDAAGDSTVGILATRGPAARSKLRMADSSAVVSDTVLRVGPGNGQGSGRSRRDSGVTNPGTSIQEGIKLIADAVAEYDAGPVFALFSGGHDSLSSTHLAAQYAGFYGALHCNTGIGIKETGDFVRNTCLEQGWRLYEYHARERNGRPIYDDMCLRLGMPGGPMAHSSQYHVLKEESLERAMAEHRQGNRPVAFVTGIRKKESKRRMKNAISVPFRLDKGRLWISPILEWSAGDVNDYLSAAALPRNPVVDLLHRSGECLCGALAHRDELKEIAYWYPDVARRIYGLEKACFESGLSWEWGDRRVGPPPKEQMALPLCQSCETRWDKLPPLLVPTQAEIGR